MPGTSSAGTPLTFSASLAHADRLSHQATLLQRNPEASPGRCRTAEFLRNAFVDSQRRRRGRPSYCPVGQRRGSSKKTAVPPIENTSTKNYVAETARGLIALEGMGLLTAGFNTRVSRRPIPRPRLARQ
jgi:hypothetical protein